MAIRLWRSRKGGVALLSFGFLVGFLAGILEGPGVRPAGAVIGQSGNGDVNADGRIDLTDAVGLLNYLFLGGPPPAPIACPPIRASTVLVVRHAERLTAGTDPCLTEEGKARALHLRDALSRAEVHAIFATSYCRTSETVKPLAEARSLEIRQPGEVPALVEALRALPAGSSSVVAANSFNIAEILHGLGVEGAVVVRADEYDNVWVVTFAPSGKLATSVAHLRY